MWLGFNKKRFPIKLMMAFMKNEWQLEIERTFGGAPFDSAIQFNGYETKMILLFSQFKCNNAIYVHSDMVKEIELKDNQRWDVLGYAYKKYDNVALVTEDIRESTARFVKKTDNFRIAHNMIAYDEIVRRGEGEIAFDEGVTESNKELSEIKGILAGESKVLVSVGRYSPEKDHKRMIDAFNKVWLENNNTYFVIIGGIQRDGIYDELCEYVETLPCGNNVILILSMTNPLPIVKACDGFILASHYEGFGLAIVEADIMGLPAVSTDITGPRTFMKKNNGTLVENTFDGVVEGMKMLIDGKVPMLTTDYKKYNEDALEEFKALIR
jgi:CDP-glycerol glycerophosphotransferase